MEEPTWYLLEEQCPFSQSYLWDLQRKYFAARGIEAWRLGEVPHYITSNPVIANSYAEIVFAFLRDQDRLAPAGGLDAEPLHICELGAGSGRFAYHFLTSLLRLCEQAGVAPESFRYVLTDQAASNIEFWRKHPRFQTWITRNLLDVAVFDILASRDIALETSGRSITAGSLGRPLVVIANYVFDSIPQDLFYLDEGICRQCLVSLAVDADPETLDDVELLARVQCQYDLQDLDGPAYEEPWLQQLLAGYQNALTDTHLLFPAQGLRGLQRLRALSKDGLLLLSADKGDHRLTALQGRPAPGLVRHGSFSLSVNYHAIKEYCQRSGGVAMFPNTFHRSLNVGACLLVHGAADHLETRSAYQRHVQDFSPDDFYTITKHTRPIIGEMSVDEILAYLRLSRYDSQQFGRFLPRLAELAEQLDRGQRQAVIDAIDRVWTIYFPLGEKLDLANAIALLLCGMGEFRRALELFRHSIDMYGPNVRERTDVAATLHRLGRTEDAKSLLQMVLAHEPSGAEAQELMDSIRRAEAAV